MYKRQRQTITKWENGLISPSLEYLIDLSQIFNVTIDFLIKDDDCISEDAQTMNTNTLITFLIKAKKMTYAAKKNKVQSVKKDAHEYHYQDNEYQYYDTFYGRSYFSGQEIVYQNDQVCWSMNYYGKVLSSDFNGDFLKEALMLVDEDVYKRQMY